MKLSAAHGLLALAPTALDVEHPLTTQHRTTVVRYGTAIVHIRGPLAHHELSEGDCDSYDGIVERIKTALARVDVRRVLLVIDSPGGLVSGRFDAVRDIRRIAKRANKQIIAFAETALSASYAWACAAEGVFASPCSLVGSIGVIQPIVSSQRRFAEIGHDVALITSGARKADGHEYSELTAEVCKAFQKQVDEGAQQFFELVAEARPITVKQVRELEAGIFSGRRALELKLVDGTSTLEQLCEMLDLDEAKRVLADKKAQNERAAKEEKVRAERKKRQDAEMAAAFHKSQAANATERARQEKRGEQMLALCHRLGRIPTGEEFDRFYTSKPTAEKAS